MNTRTRRRIIENINRNTADPQRLDPGKPMPHIICKEALPHMERPASMLLPVLAGITVGIIIGIAAVNYLP